MEEIDVGSARAVEAVRAVVAPVDARPEVSHTSAGTVVVVKTPGVSYPLLLMWIGEGFPSDARAALHKLKVGIPRWGQIPVIVAARMSAGARRLVEELNLSWADESGQARIMGPPALVIVRVAASPPSGTSARFAWSPSAGAVAEAVLDAPMHRAGGPLPHATVLASALDWSTQQVSRILQGFDRQGWTVKTGSRGSSATRVLAAPGDLLSSWARWHHERDLPTLQLHAVWRDPHIFAASALATSLPSHSWCLSGWLAAAQIAPYATSIPDITCYLDGDVWDRSLDSVLDGLRSEAGVRVVENGSRLRLVRAERQVLTLSSAGPVPLAAPARVYADLLRGGSRGESAAEHLRESVLGI